MKHIKTFESFLFESKTNIAPEIDQEIQDLIAKLCQNPDCEQIDQGYVEMVMPFDVWPNSKNEDFKNKMGLVFFPELLAYNDPDQDNKVQRVPWIAVRLNLESDSAAWVNGVEDQNVTSEFLKRVIENLEKAGYKPFMDEDATRNHWRRETSGGDSKTYTNVDYTCFVNPSYPDGFWENHALEA
jgi:hypothetical protein